ncbi:TonB-dependent receptor [bacterium]|nr:TonB-dependent receptor [bacterium]
MNKEHSLSAVPPIPGLIMLILCVGMWNLIGSGTRVYALTTGSLHGIVTTMEGLALADVTINVRSSTMAGTYRTTVSGQDGSFRFLGLAPGFYEIWTEQAGLETSQQVVRIHADHVTVHNIKVLPNAGMSTIVVTAQEIQSSALPQASALNTEQIDHLPLEDNRYQDVLTLTPEITRTSDGGFHGMGSRNRQIAFMIDGENTTDPVTGTFGFNIPIDAISSLEVIPFGYSAEYGQAQGGVVNLITANGSEFWTGSVYSFSPTLDYDGLKVMGVTSWNPGFFLSGPLYPDILRLTFSSEYRYGETRIEELEPGQNRRYQQGYELFLGLSLDRNSRHQTKLTALTFPLWINNRFLAFNRPKETTVDYQQNGLALTLIDTMIFSESTTLESRLKYHQVRLALTPKGSEPFMIYPDTCRGNYYNDQDRVSHRYGYAAVLTHHRVMSGEHQLRTGFQLEQTDYRQHYFNNVIEYYNAAGQLYRRLSFTGEPTFNIHRVSSSLFVQDDWQLNDFWTIYAGLRFETDQLFDNRDWSPRLGVMLHPFRTEHMIIRAGWGRFYDQIPLVVAAYEDFPCQYETLYDEKTGEITQGPTRTLSLLDSDLKTPYGDQWFVEWEQNWFAWLLTKLRYLEKQGHDELQDIANSDLDQQISADQILFLTNANSSSYSSINISTEMKIRPDFIFTFNYNWSRAFGNGSDWNSPEGDNPDPLDASNDWTALPWDSPHRFLFQSSTALFWGMNLTCLAEYRTGYPYSIVDEDQNIVGAKNGARFPDYFRFDALLSRRFRLSKKIDVLAQGGAINLTNHFNPEYVQNNCDAQDFGSFYGSDDISLQLQIRLVPSENLPEHKEP